MLDCGETGSGGRMRRAASDESGQVLEHHPRSAWGRCSLCRPRRRRRPRDARPAPAPGRRRRCSARGSPAPSALARRRSPFSTARPREQERGQHGRQRDHDRARRCASRACRGATRRDGGDERNRRRLEVEVPTWFGKIIGINALTVSAKATACSPCTVKPLDIMIVLDRTGSMCTPPGPGSGSCPDLDNAVSGIQTFLSSWIRPSTRWGLRVTPPRAQQEHEG